MTVQDQFFVILYLKNKTLTAAGATRTARVQARSPRCLPPAGCCTQNWPSQVRSSPRGSCTRRWWTECSTRPSSTESTIKAAEHDINKIMLCYSLGHTLLTLVVFLGIVLYGHKKISCKWMFCSEQCYPLKTGKDHHKFGHCFTKENDEVWVCFTSTKYIHVCTLSSVHY